VTAGVGASHNDRRDEKYGFEYDGEWQNVWVKVSSFGGEEKL
jgi:hypothetical protein